MDAPKFEVSRTTKDGKPAVEVVVRNAIQALRDLCDSLGMHAAVDVSNRRAKICATPAEMEVVQNAMRPLFDNSGKYIGA